MNKFKRKSLGVALAAGIGAIGMAGTASAVNVNPNGLGQVLLFPYYTARNNLATGFSITNTDSYPKAVKVRFLEGKNSREVLDFNLYLSAHDMFTGAVVASGTGAALVRGNDETGGPLDTTCTAPAIPSGGVPFRSTLFSGTLVEGFGGGNPTLVNHGDGESSTIDRTAEGYFEIIEMGVVTDSAVSTAITHVSGTPPNCAFVQSASVTMGTGGTNPLSVPDGGLYGTSYLINVGEGVDFPVDPTVLDSFSTNNIWNQPGNIGPQLSDVNTPSVVFNNGAALTSTWVGWASSAADPVSAVLMHESVINDYILDQGLNASTDWVVTMPTKRYYVPVDNPNTTTNPYDFGYWPFTTTFYTGGACEPVTPIYYDREESKVSSGIDFSPQTTVGFCLPWETTVVTFTPAPSTTDSIFGSTNTANFHVNYQNGWASISFVGNSTLGSTRLNQGQYMVDDANNTFYGLPVIGFAATSYINGTLKDASGNNVLANFGNTEVHKYRNDINGNGTASGL